MIVTAWKLCMTAVVIERYNKTHLKIQEEMLTKP